MCISMISSEFEGKISVHLFRGVFNQWASVHALLYLENRDLSKFDHVCGSVSWHKQWRSLRTSEKVLVLLIGLEKDTKPYLKCLDLTNPQSDTLCTNRGSQRTVEEISCGRMRPK